MRGRKIASNDPDLGHWTYAYDTATELISQTDAKNQTTTLSYDKLGRLTQRVEPDMTSVWVYDTAAHGIGKLASASITAGPSAGYQRSFAYDTMTRPTQATVTVGGTAYSFAATYDGNSRLSGVTYPSGLALNYTYTSLGYAQQVVGPAGVAYWTANARAELHLTQQTAGNGVVTSQSFDVETGRLTAILAGTGNIVENFSYTYGRARQRADPRRRQREPERDLHLRHPQPRHFSDGDPEYGAGEELHLRRHRQPAVEVRCRELYVSAGRDGSRGRKRVHARLRRDARR